ncbi:MAG: efflux RND transporter periplasmic adaptor subunit [Myxococcales bacterium]|nr:efflux RND transporter periplasmic adaptor subunit [Myxococcales bacterium]
MRNLLLPALVLLLPACASTRAETHAPQAPLVVRVADATAGEGVDRLVLEGITRATDRAVLGLQQGGRLASRPVRVGDAVPRGAVLATLDDRAWRNQLAALDAQVAATSERVEQIGRDLARLEGLGARGSVAKADLEALRSARSAAADELAALTSRREDARRQRDEAVLRAPFAGTVVAVHAEPGEVVGAGQPVIELAGSGLEVAVQVPEAAWVRLSHGTVASVRLPALQETVPADVVDLASAAGSRGLFPVVVGIGAGGRRVPGLSAEVVLEVPGEAEVTVPVRSIVDPTGGRPSVFRVRDDRAARVPVQVRGLRGDTVGVIGLDPGDVVVVAGQARLVDGDAVVVLP